MSKQPIDKSDFLTNVHKNPQLSAEQHMYNLQAEGLSLMMQSNKMRNVLQQTQSEVGRLLKEYFQKLLQDGNMLRLSEIKKMNILDTTSFLGQPDNDYSMPVIKPAVAEERDAIQKMNWYAFVPCFEEGAVKVNKFRYMVYKVDEIDPEERYIIVTVRDYMRIEGQWQPGVTVSVKVSVPAAGVHDDEARYIQIDQVGGQTHAELYTMYTAKELGWSPYDWKLWDEIVVHNATKTREEMIDKYQTDQLEQLATIFIHTISRCNAMLEMNKPSRPISQKTDGSPKGKRHVSYESGAAPKHKVRTVGALRVQSENIPRKPCLETVVTYKVAKWTVRGHIRRYRNGKEVYIKPAVHQRKALAQTGEATTTTIRFKKRKEKKEDEQ